MAEMLRDAPRCCSDLSAHAVDVFRTLALDKDVMIVEGPDTREEGSVIGLTVTDQAHLLDARVLVIARGQDPLLLDRIMAYRRDLGDALLGVVLNIVPRASMSYITQSIVPALERLGIPVYGILPEDRTLRSVSAQQIVEYLDGRLLCAPTHAEGLIEHIVVGAMSVEAALDHLKRRERTALVTGGDRTDLLFAALANDEVIAATSVFILTGDLHPSSRLLGLAEAKGIPVVLVPHDTRYTADMLDKAFGRVRYAQSRKIDRFGELLAEKFDFQRLARALGLD
jgi:BioD-like phosphotransacetylase family protein